MKYSFTPKVKITDANITFGPNMDVTDELVLMTVAKELTDRGYRKTSNAYCLVSRIDREDWLEVLAKERRCSVADFYNVDGSGVGDQHRDYYVRVHSKDNLTVSPAVYARMERYH